jgi:nucleotide-binding universal stress UspA family protein
MKSLLDLKGREFCAAVASNGRRAEWRSILGIPTEVVSHEARAADLLIIGNKPESPNPFLAVDPTRVLLQASRPVLVVPNRMSALASRRIGVAWTDAREARRAVRDALPFLHHAESVMIIEVSEGDGGEAALGGVKDVAAYLNRHGIDPVAVRVRPDEVGATNSLLQAVHDENIDLIVAGGYGHSRLGEWMFGGVSRGLLMESPICCLLSH